MISETSWLDQRYLVKAMEPKDGRFAVYDQKAGEFIRGQSGPVLTFRNEELAHVLVLGLLLGRTRQ
jgi:hypothetical protein